MILQQYRSSQQNLRRCPSSNSYLHGISHVQVLRQDLCDATLADLKVLFRFR